MEQDDVTFVTDNGSSVVAALRVPFKRISCCGHNLNLVIANKVDDKSADLLLLSNLTAAITLSRMPSALESIRNLTRP